MFLNANSSPCVFMGQLDVRYNSETPLENLHVIRPEMLVQFHTFAGHLPGPVLGTRHKKALYRALDLKSTWGMRLAPMPWWVGEGWFRLRLFALVITSIAFIVCFLLYFMSFFPKAGKGKVTPASGNNLQILTLSLRPTGNISCPSIILQVTSKKISTYLFKNFIIMK